MDKIKIDDLQSWKRLPQDMLKNYHVYGGGFLEIWYIEHTMQNKYKVTYNSPADAIQVELGGTAIYQNIALDKFKGSFNFFRIFKDNLRRIGGHDIDVLVIDQPKLETYLKKLGYTPHPDRNQKFWYRKQVDPIDPTNPVGVSNTSNQWCFRLQRIMNGYDIWVDSF